MVPLIPVSLRASFWQDKIFLKNLRSYLSQDILFLTRTVRIRFGSERIVRGQRINRRSERLKTKSTKYDKFGSKS